MHIKNKSNVKHKTIATRENKKKNKNKCAFPNNNKNYKTKKNDKTKSTNYNYIVTTEMGLLSRKHTKILNCCQREEGKLKKNSWYF